MGLDMYLTGKKYYSHQAPEKIVDGFRLSEEVLDLGYWRKHPNLHGYIIENFANGVDDCTEIDLGKDDLQDIINAVKSNQLPETEGFFFGVSDDSDEQKNNDIAILKHALDWLQKSDDKYWHSVVYQASW